MPLPKRPPYDYGETMPITQNPYTDTHFYALNSRSEVHTLHEAVPALSPRHWERSCAGALTSHQIPSLN